MKIEAPVSTDQIKSPRNGRFIHGFLASLGQAQSLVDHPNLDDPGENALRIAVLRGTRGYPDRLLFTGLPQEMTWYTAVAGRNEIPLFRYGAYPDWWKLSAGTGLVGDGAARVDRQ